MLAAVTLDLLLPCCYGEVAIATTIVNCIFVKGRTTTDIVPWTFPSPVFTIIAIKPDGPGTRGTPLVVKPAAIKFFSTRSRYDFATSTAEMSWASMTKYCHDDNSVFPPPKTTCEKPFCGGRLCADS